MKNLIKKSLLAVVLLTTIISNATNINNNIRVNVIESKLIDLKLNNSDGDLKISVKDVSGETLYTEKFQGNYFSKKYDLKTLPTGNYYFEIEGFTKINRMPFKVTVEGLEFTGKIESTFYKPTVRQDGDLVFISKITFNKEKLEISLVDDQLNTLYTEELGNDINLRKTLNLMNLKSGTYTVFTKSAGKSFEQKIYKK